MTDAASSSRRKFLVVADDTPEFAAALKYACRRARSTHGHVALLKVISPAEFEHWSGVREEIERQERAEAETLLQSLAAHTDIHFLDDHSVLYRIHTQNTSAQTDWALPLLAAAVGVRQGQGLVGRGRARDRDAVGALSESEFLMGQFDRLSTRSAADSLALWQLLATDGADRRTTARRIIKSWLRSRAARVGIGR